MLSNRQLYLFYSASTVVTSVILIVLYAVSLWLITRTTKQPFVTYIVILLILSNIGSVGVIWCNLELDYNTNYKPYILPQSGFGLLRDTCFNVGHWWFASEYYNSAVAMPFIFNHEEVPESTRIKLEKLFKRLMIANIAVPVPYYIILTCVQY